MKYLIFGAGGIGLAPGATTFMQRDVAEGHALEVDGLVYQVVRMGRQYSVPFPAYEKIAEKELRT